MWYFNGQTIKTPKEMVISDITYPRAIFRDSDTLTSLGIKPYSETTPDSRYYWNGAFTLDESGAEVVGSYAGTARDVDTLKASMLDTINSQVASKQGAIDWYWARADKGGKAIPSEISDYATTIYSEQATKESEVVALSTLEEIMEYENRSHTEVRKVKHTSEEGVETYGPETTSETRHINMLQHWTANPTDEVDEAFVSLTAD
ncbi:MAG: hypothetical protein QGH83_09895 [Candidatus Pacebacteria bacterium]|nr:hypothetical protein [Candidatus Paceibacterota bacterium]